MKNDMIFNNLLKIQKEEKSNMIKEIIDITLNEILDYEKYDEYFNNLFTYGCSAGVCKNLIYYSDTEDFFDRNSSEILDFLNELKEIYNFENLEYSKNNITWLTYEIITNRIYNELLELNMAL